MKGKKGFDAKAFLVNHAEKLGFGLIALTVVGVWASEFFGGSWARETRNPDALIQDIESKKRTIDSGIWPAEKQAEFKPVDFSERAAMLFRPINTARYEFSTELFVPLNRPKEKAREPELLAVESLIATPGHAILAIISEEDRLLDEFDPMKPSSEGDEDEEPDEFTRRDRGTARGASGAVAGLGGMRFQSGADEEGPPALFDPRKDKKLAKYGPGALPTGGAALVGQMESEKRGRARKGLRTLSGQAPAGRFFVAVRGVWPIRQQLEKIRRALHLPTTSAALEHLDLLDFELERQVAVKGEDPWSKPWEKIDVSRAMEILREVDGFDDDPVDMAIFDPVITMPLPMRAFGVWTNEATHPRIKDFILTEEGKERERLLMARLKEESERMRLEEEQLRGPYQKKGFASEAYDFRSMATRMTRVDPRGMSSMMKDLSKDLRNTGMGADLTEDKLKEMVTAVGQLLLFRYFDFDVRPGYAYRYRVKLVLKNPNYERPVSEVVDPSVAEGIDRTTPASNASNPAVVPISPRYFLKSVERHPLASEGGRNRAIANVSMYEMHKEFGTRVSSTVELRTLGQFVGGTKVVEALDVTVPEIEDQEYPFTSDDVLIDVAPDLELPPDMHPDLPLQAKKKVATAGMTPEAMVMDASGDLKLLLAGQDRAEENRLKSQLERERKQFEGLKKRDETANPLDATPYGRGNMPIPDTDDGGARRTRRGGGRAAVGGGEAMMRRADEANPRRRSPRGRSGGRGGGGMLPAFAPQE